MSKEKVNTSKGPLKNSIRSQKRASRGFKSLALSTRKGRRAAKRLNIACNINGQLHDPGAKVSNRNNSKNTMTAGGRLCYH